MRFTAALLCCLFISGCASRQTATRKSEPASTATSSEYATKAERVEFASPPQVQLASGRVIGAPPPTTKLGVSAPYMLKAPT
ncbi:MAG TPA: hypothetical protein VEK08_10445 [Planctomycetota bacterium]|nr:hypothetical protein [Planctomycetota bacterium]